MAQRMNFTMAALSAVRKPESGRKWIYDSKVPGLALAVTLTGAKSFYWYRKVNGRPERVRIGDFPSVTVDTARDHATAHNASLVAGENPAESKRKRKGQLTLQELFDTYLEQHAIPHKKASSVLTDRATYKRYMTGWTSRKLSSISRNDVLALHRTVGKDAGKYAANRLLSLLSKMFSVAATLENPFPNNPCRGIKSFAEKSRDRFLQPEELPRFLEAVDTLENQTAANAFRLMLLTGARKGNVLSMQWEHINFAGQRWTMPDTKANEPQTVPLHPMAVEILSTMKRNAKNGNRDSPYVFPSKIAGAKAPHLQDLNVPWRLVREKAGLPGLRMHDLRRTLGSWMVAGGTSLPIIGKTLGHHDPTTTAIYSRLNLDPVRQAVDLAVNSMLAAGKAEKPPENKTE